VSPRQSRIRFAELRLLAHSYPRNAEGAGQPRCGRNVDEGSDWDGAGRDRRSSRPRLKGSRATSAPCPEGKLDYLPASCGRACAHDRSEHRRADHLAHEAWRAHANCFPVLIRSGHDDASVNALQELASPDPRGTQPIVAGWVTAPPAESPCAAEAMPGRCRRAPPFLDECSNLRYQSRP
jgi:hypothetical protein